MDKTCRIYNETTSAMERSKHELREVISKTHIEIIKNIISKEFEKLFNVSYSESWRNF